MSDCAAEAEFGVDVGEVGLHGARRDESLVATSLLASPSLTSRTTSRSAGVSDAQAHYLQRQTRGPDVRAVLDKYAGGDRGD